MSEQNAVEKPNLSVPTLQLSEVTTPNEELVCAIHFAKLEKSLRTIEAQRKERTNPIRKVLEDYAEAARSMAAPLEEERDRVAAMMENYRLSDEVQGKLADLRKMKADFRKAERSGDLSLVTQLAEDIALAEVEPSVTVENGFVAYRTSIEIVSIDESVLDESLFKRIPDEKKIKEMIDTLGTCSGVEFKWRFKPSLTVKG